ncbi:macro domain-containing protein [Paenibacillus sp. URB8-2]|uniref:macro domain-containing protein n=1 Tax=Paenibacillus sp. URB8-2 TaxID=2741301 RepID=UPI0015BEC662|nr:macro domain-containing protein [Paenibacillus sp. URB8-2]BCG59018.1 O-acetyl-ADP-ribose deacetylase [Paenibacillus sp. URB8-2]
MKVTINQTVISAEQGDITSWSGDCIVNAANTGLFGGGGVDGAIHRAGGPKIAEECALIRSRQGGCLPGEAVATGAGNLPFRAVIHTVGPIWKGGTAGEADILTKCYINSLALAAALSARSVAFPNISTGIYGFPKPLACSVAMNAVAEYVNGAEQEDGVLERIDFICYEGDNARLYQEALTNMGKSVSE